MERISQKMNCIVNQKGFVKQKKVVDAFEIAHYALYVSPQRVNFSATRSKLVYSVTGKKSMLSIGTGVITMVSCFYGNILITVMQQNMQ